MDKYQFFMEKLGDRAEAIQQTEGRKQAIQRDAAPVDKYQFFMEKLGRTDPIETSADVAAQSAPEPDRPQFDFTEAAGSMMGTAPESNPFRRPGDGAITGITRSLFQPKDPNRSVMDGYQPQDAAADAERRLAYGAGPISQQTVQQADDLRSGRTRNVSSTARQVALAMNDAGEKSSRQQISEVDTIGNEVASDMMDAASLRDFSDIARDSAITLYNGVLTVPQLITNVIAPDSALAKDLRKSEEYLNSEESDVTQANVRLFQSRINSEEGFLGKYVATVSELLTNPTLATREILRQVPMFMSIIGAARVGGAVAGGGVSVAEGISPTLSLAELISSGAIRSAATAAGTTAGGMGASMTMSAGEAAGSTYQRLVDPRQTPPSVWAENPDYQQLRAEGYSHKDAVEEIAVVRSRIAAIQAAPLGILGYMGAESALLSKAGRAGAPRQSAGRIIGTELVTEQIEEGGTQLAGNAAVKAIDPRQELLEGVPQAMGTAAVTSLPFSAAAAANSSRQGRQQDILTDILAEREFSRPRKLSGEVFPEETVNIAARNQPASAAPETNTVGDTTYTQQTSSQPVQPVASSTGEFNPDADLIARTAGTRRVDPEGNPIEEADQQTVTAQPAADQPAVPPAKPVVQQPLPKPEDYEGIDVIPAEEQQTRLTQAKTELEGEFSKDGTLKEGEQVDLKLATPESVGQDRYNALNTIALALKRAFDVDVLLADFGLENGAAQTDDGRQIGDAAYHGWYAGDGKTVVLNVRSDRITDTLAHEPYHVLEQRFPDLFAPIFDLSMDSIDPAALKKMAETYGLLSGQLGKLINALAANPQDAAARVSLKAFLADPANLKKTKGNQKNRVARSEIVAHVVGQMATPKMYTELVKRTGSAKKADEILKVIGDYLKAVYNALTGKQLKFVKGPDSIKQIRSAMQQIQNEWQSRTAQQRAANKPAQTATPAATQPAAQTTPQTAQKPAQAAPETVEVEAPQPPAKKPPKTAKKGGAAEPTEAAEAPEAAVQEAPKAPPKKAEKSVQETVAKKPQEPAATKPAAGKSPKPATAEEPATTKVEEEKSEESGSRKSPKPATEAKSPKPAKKTTPQRSEKAPNEDVQWAREQLDALSTLEGVGVGAVKKVAAGMARRGLIDAEDVAVLDGNPEDMVDQLRAAVSDARLSKTKEKPAEKESRFSRALTNTPEFKEWFGNSKVVDGKGRPLVVYHGTSADFNVFTRGDIGFHFGTKKQARDRGSRLMATYLSIQNPLYMPDIGSWDSPTTLLDDLGEDFGMGVLSTAQVEEISALPSNDEKLVAIRAAIEAAGYDGITYDNEYEGDEEGDGEPSWIVFRADQIKSATGNVGPFGQRQPAEDEAARVGMTPEQAVEAQQGGDIRLSRTPLGFYSALADGVEKVTTNSSPAVGWKAIVKGFVNKGQVKQDEVDWSGINDWLDLQKGKVSKEAVKQYLDANGVQVEETVLGAEEKTDFWVLDADGERIEAGNFATRAEAEAVISDLEADLGMEGLTIQEPRFAGMSRYGQYGPPGGENYREVLLRLPQSTKADDALRKFQNRMADKYPSAGIMWRREANEQELAEHDRLKAAWQKENERPDYRSSHWDDPNVLAHLRMDDRTDADGNRVLFIREIQSDWGQQRKKNLRMAEKSGSEMVRAGADKQTPDAPFIGKTDAWVSLALKRAIVMAAEQGYDKVALVTGRQAAEMFSLDKTLREIAYEPAGDGLYEITATDLQGNEVFSEDEVTLDRVEDLVGKEIAEKIAADEGERDADGFREWRYLRGNNLKVEAKGMRGFYDNIVPKVAKEVVKKLGGKMESVEMERGKPSRAPSEGTPFLDWMAVNHPEVKRVDAARAWSMGIDNNSFVQEYYAATKRMQQPGFDITPEMREKVSTGLPLFSKTLLVDGVERPTQNDQGTQIHPTVEGVTNFWREFADAKTVDAQGRPQRWYHGTARNILAFRPKQAGATFATQSPKFAEEFAEASEDWMTNNATQFLTARQMQEARDYAANAFLRSALARTMTEADREKSVANIKRNTPTESWHDVLISRAYRDQLPTNANIIPVYINATNPFDYENPDHIAELNRYEEQNRYTDRTISEFVGPIQRGNWQAMEATGVQDAIKAMGHDGFYVMEGGNKNLGVYDTTKIKSAIGNVGTFGNRLPTAEEAARLGMTEADAAGAQAAGGIRLSRTPIAGNRFTLKGRGFVEQYIDNILLNEMSRVKNVQAQVVKAGGVMVPESNVDIINRMMIRKSGQQVERFRKTIVIPLVKRASKEGIDLKDVALMAYALHAPSRNAYVAGIDPTNPDGGSGMTNAEIRATIADLRRRHPGAKYIKLVGLAKDFQKITDMTRQVLVDGGIIDEGRKWNVYNDRGLLLTSFPTKAAADSYATTQGKRTGKFYRVEEYVGVATRWKEKWKNYVPLKGFENVDEDGQGTGATDPRQDFSKRALGRRSRAANIIETILADHERALMMVSTNNVRKAMLRFVLDNPDDKLWEVNKVVLTRKLMRTMSNGSVIGAASAVVEYQHAINKGRKDTVAVRVGGEIFFITLKDPGMVADLERMTGASEAAVREWFRVLSAPNRFLGKVTTSFSPPFIAINFLRDWPRAALRTLRFEGPKQAGKVLLGSVTSMRSIRRAIRTGNWTGTASKYERWFNEMREVGGSMGIVTQINIDYQHDRLMNALSNYQGALAGDWKTWGRPFKNVFGRALDFISDYNNIIEQGPRVAAYAAYREAFEKANPNATPQQIERNKIEASDVAANVTLDFARRGKKTAVASALYLFFNPAVQGPLNDAEMFLGRKSEKTFDRIWKGTALATPLIGLGYMIASMSAEAAGEDDEPYWNSSDNDAIKRRNLLFITAEGARWTIPMAYGAVGFFVYLGYIIHDVVNGKGIAKAAWELANAAAVHFSPFGEFANPATALAPTALKLPIVLGTGINEQGRPLLPPDRGDGKPQSERYWPSARGTAVQKATTWLNEVTGGDTSHEGGISISPHQADYIIRFFTGGLGSFIRDAGESSLLTSEMGLDSALDKGKIPIVKSLYRNQTFRMYQANFNDAAKAVSAAARAHQEQESNANMSEKTEARLQSSRPLAELDESLKTAREELADIRKREVEIIDSDLSTAEKEAQRKELDYEKQQIYVEFNRAYYAAKRFASGD